MLCSRSLAVQLLFKVNNKQCRHAGFFMLYFFILRRACRFGLLADSRILRLELVRASTMCFAALLSMSPSRRKVYISLIGMGEGYNQTVKPHFKSETAPNLGYANSPEEGFLKPVVYCLLRSASKAGNIPKP